MSETKPEQPDGPGAMCDECGHFAARHGEDGCPGVKNGCDCGGMLWLGVRWPRPWLPAPDGLVAAEPHMTVIEFLLARLDELEQSAKRWRQRPDAPDFRVSTPMFETDDPSMVEVQMKVTSRWSQAELMTRDELRERYYEPAEPDAERLRDAAAKRRIVEMYLAEADQTGPAIGNQEAHTARLGALADVIQTLAAVYAGHEDWNPDWSVSE